MNLKKIDIIIMLFGVYNIVFKKHVSQANISGKLFISFSSAMIIFYIYQINTIIAVVFYTLSLITMFISTYFYLREYKKIRLK